MHGFKSGDYDRKINCVFVIAAILLALCFGIGLCVPMIIKAGPFFY